MYLSFLCASIIASIFLALIRALQKTRAREQEEIFEERDETHDVSLERTEVHETHDVSSEQWQNDREKLLEDAPISVNQHFAEYWDSIIHSQVSAMEPDPMETIIADEINQVMPTDQPGTPSTSTAKQRRAFRILPDSATAATQIMIDEALRDVDPTAMISENPDDLQNICQYFYGPMPMQILRQFIAGIPMTSKRINASIPQATCYEVSQLIDDEHISHHILRQFLDILIPSESERAIIERSVCCEPSPLADDDRRKKLIILPYNAIIVRIHQQRLVITNRVGSIHTQNLVSHSWIPIAQIAHHIICAPPNAQTLIESSSCGMRSKCTFLVLTATNPSDPNCAQFNASVIKPRFTANFAEELKTMYRRRELTEIKIAHNIIVNPLLTDEQRASLQATREECLRQMAQPE